MSERERERQRQIDRQIDRQIGSVRVTETASEIRRETNRW